MVFLCLKSPSYKCHSLNSQFLNFMILFCIIPETAYNTMQVMAIKKFSQVSKPLYLYMFSMRLPRRFVLRAYPCIYARRSDLVGGHRHAARRRVRPHVLHRPPARARQRLALARDPAQPVWGGGPGGGPQARPSRSRSHAARALRHSWTHTERHGSCAFRHQPRSRPPVNVAGSYTSESACESASACLSLAVALALSL